MQQLSNLTKWTIYSTYILEIYTYKGTNHQGVVDEPLYTFV